MATSMPWTVVSRSLLMSLIITFMFEPAKLADELGEARGTGPCRALAGRPDVTCSAMVLLPPLGPAVVAPGLRGRAWNPCGHVAVPLRAAGAVGQKGRNVPGPGVDRVQIMDSYRIHNSGPPHWSSRRARPLGIRKGPPVSVDTTPRTARPNRQAGKATGAWADGDPTPLNPNEEFKQADDGLNVRARIEEIYAKQGFDSIPGDDLRGRMRWWGLYTQRKPGIDGGQTASLDPAELDDQYFMLRVRSDGGALSAEQRTIAGISTEFGRDTADISDRQNIQLHWIRIEDVPEIWDRLEGVGLTTAEACGDTPRVILGPPVAGIAADEVVDGTPAVRQILENYIGSPEFSNLPRKFKTAISGSPSLDVAHEVNDIFFVGVHHPDFGGLRRLGRRRPVDQPDVRPAPGAWVSLEEVPEVWKGVVSIFRDYGYRRLRNRARLKFLMADWGPERFREVLEKEYLGRALVDGPAPQAPPSHRRDHVGVHPQQDGRFWVGVAPVAGRVSGTTLNAVAELAERHGSGRVRLSAQQKLLVLDVPQAEVAALADGLEGSACRAPRVSGDAA